ncbi:AlbA family DNA-binding domain-containing protein [Flectobacillus major]|jgi:predicted HTH transcriptional regulator|uniref:AlbA family DNA-binding domain-containing protein n=1 Tax=Flectobacillus major TaxID=103 RepID=UPI0004046D30|nr:ATP-binding protein [Flectobacillus major]
MSELIEKFLQQRESSNLEFKSKIDNPFKIARTLAAFANTSGGTLLIGINDDRTVKGCTELDEMLKIEQAAEHLIVPPIAIRYRSEMWEGKRKVLIIEVDESIDKPHEAIDEKGNRTVYVRANDQTTPVGKEMSQILDKADKAVEKEILEQPNVKYLIMYLKKNKRIAAREYAKLVNISEYRAKKLLETLTYEGVLLMLTKQRPPQFVLK